MLLTMIVDAWEWGARHLHRFETLTVEDVLLAEDAGKLIPDPSTT